MTHFTVMHSLVARSVYKGQRFLVGSVNIAAMVLAGALAISWASQKAFAFNTNPTPYDPENFVPSTLAPRSTSSYFFIDAHLPKYLKGAFDRQQVLGVTGFFIGGTLDKGRSEVGTVSTKDIAILQPPNYVCSAYSADSCFNIGKFYAANRPQIGVTGLFGFDNSTMLQWGFNTGYDSPKLTISPAVLVGVAKRFYFNDERASHIIFEASQWLGGSVKHRPCLDDFNRSYYCATISAWSEFSYDPHPTSAFFKVTYATVF